MTSQTEPEARPRALVIGTGLIGGSIALGLRAHGWHVSGQDADPARTAEALASGVVDAVGDDLSAQIVFVATPAAAVAAEVGRVLSTPGRRDDVVVTDVSGVKTAIVEAADHPRFIGGHPMAGSEQIGLHGADPDLFEGAVWVLTPTAETDLTAFTQLQHVVGELGADVLVLSASDHDRLVAVVSHVPHLVAATLMNAATSGAEQDGSLLRLAAGGFRDMTRVAAGHPGIWPDICTENAGPIVAALTALIEQLGLMRDRVAGNDRDAILGELQRASAGRRNLPARIVRPGNLSELRIPVPDRHGVLAEITSLAADAGIGIYDIEIAHSAEGPRGVLILVVDSAEAGRLGQSVEAVGYRCRIEALS
ncbi:MAG TPA: prephenate dehydrogenase/arogenate dehydrogenase family protein [Acidimicrobiales bacterium]|jgi:prephenate dehydrogenase|nr:prephenate dehydrogenase/arogenate dehydrogenase family protein [Acidimicrobiales bacterium]